MDHKNVVPDASNESLPKKSSKKRLYISHSFAFKPTKSKERLVTNKHCLLCDVGFTSEAHCKVHIESSSHKFVLDFERTMKKPRGHRSIVDFSIEGVLSFGYIPVPKDVSTIMFLNVKNITKKNINFTEIIANISSPDFNFAPIVPITLVPQETTSLKIKVTHTKLGILYVPILFYATTSNGPENIPLELTFQSHSPIYNDLRPEEPYRRPTGAVLEEFVETEDLGERPQSEIQRVPDKIALKPYKLNVDVSIVLNTGLKTFKTITQKQEFALRDIKKLLDVPDKMHCLTQHNYKEMLDMLLYIEEHQMNKDIRDYDKANQTLKKVPGFLELEVPGLAEHRPSLIWGDAVSIREHPKSTTIYTGFVHKVNESSVWLKFSYNFVNNVYIPNKKFYVSFSFNRHALKTEHQAIEFAHDDKIVPFMFPKSVHQNELVTAKLHWYNSQIEKNAEQQKAIQAILRKTAMPSPYLVFGPPGTGKTSTVVEAVHQIISTTNENVLICTPSNNAANEVALKLIKTFPSKIFRLMAFSYPPSLIPSDLKKRCNYNGGSFYAPKIQELMKHRVIITTLISAARLINGGCPPNHFGYVFLDESGQATETETLIPIARILSSPHLKGIMSGQVVLVGDPKQLGPIIHSTLALQYGYGNSMLERLMETCDVYKKNPDYNPNAVVKLIQNYRSHPAILQVPNELFYDNELKPSGADFINLGLGWEHLPNPKFPVVFHSVSGSDLREKNSPSFFNISEIEVVMGYVDKLIGTTMKGYKIKETDIGIISPYKKQVDKIIKARDKKYTKELMVGSVEQIQGQERLIVIISTVRSRPEFLKFDNKFHLGFLRNPKRFNVAVTRAKALLIVVGNPNILMEDECWNRFLKYCKDNNGVTGEPFVLQKPSGERLIDDLNALNLNEGGNSVDGANFSRGNL